jgi:protein gp37
MADRSAIEWTDATWNPWHGCLKVSPGCQACYMYREKTRYGQDPRVVVRSRTTFGAPLRWTEPRRVFTCSWSDFFIAEADAWRPDAWDIIRATPHLTYQVLTKRPERIAAHLPPDWQNGWRHVWLGVSIETRAYAHRADVLRAIPAALRFLSLEPLLEDLGPLDLSGIGWVIAGGESGGRPSRALVLKSCVQGDCDAWCPCQGTGYAPKPDALEWIRSVRDQCVAAGVPFFF